MTEYLMITRDNFIHLTDTDLRKKKMGIEDVIHEIRRVLFEVVAKENGQEVFTDFWTPERGFC